MRLLSTSSSGNHRRMTAVAVPGSPRLPWESVPADIRAIVDERLGSPVVRAVSQHGGFSPGAAARLWCADGTTAFAKAVSSQQNVGTPLLHRSELRIAGTLPAAAPVPRFRFGYDDGDWVALVFDASPGRLPELPWTFEAASRVGKAVAALSASLTPCPLPDAVTVASRLTEDLTSWSRIAADPPADLDPWERRHLDRLVDSGARLLAGGALDGDTLLHLDLRADNILLEPGGRVVFVDWPWACRGAAWIDLVLFALDPMVYSGIDPQGLVDAGGGLSGVEPAAVTGLLLGLAGMWALAARQPVPPGMPTLRAHQRRFHDAALAWGRRRAGWD